MTTPQDLSAVGPRAADFHVPPPQKDAESLVDLGDVFRIFWLGKWRILIVMLIAIIGAAYYAYGVAVPKYRSTTVLILDIRGSNIVSFDNVVEGIGGNLLEINSELAALQSRVLMGRVVDDLGLVQDPEFNGALLPPSLRQQAIGQLRTLLGSPPRQAPVTNDPAILAEQDRRARDRAINALLRSITVSIVPRTLVFEITVETEEAQKSALIADTVAETYIQDQLNVKFEATEQATSWLTDRVAELQGELEAAQGAIAEFNATTDLISAETVRAQEIQLKDTRDRIQDEQSLLIQTQARLVQLEAATDRETQAVVADDLQLSRLLPRAQTDGQIAEAFDARFAQILARAELDAARSKSQIDALVDAQDTLVERIDSQNADLIQLQQLNREAEAVRLLYEYFLTRLQETSAQRGIQQADTRVLSPAVVPLRAAVPRKPFIIAMSAVLGLLIGAAFVLWREVRQSGFRTAQDLESHTGYTVLGQIPQIPARKRRHTLTYLMDKPASNAAEAYRNLRTSLMLSNVDNPPKVIISTSCVPSEGKTTNSLALAQNLTGLGQKVLIIEGDIRRRTFTQYLDNLPNKGLVSVLSGDIPFDDALVYDEKLKASILAGEKTSANAADILASVKFKNLIETAREKFDVVIIDTPPVLVVPDARIIGQSADAVLFTVRWDMTSKTQIDEGLRMFHSSGQRITGFVLSQINTRRMKSYGYGGRYGAYAGYGAQYYKN